MSADNVIIIKRVDDVYHVWHASMSQFIEGDEDPPKADVADHHIFEFWTEAMIYAEDLEKEIGLVEYGIVEIGTLSEIVARKQKELDQKEISDLVEKLKAEVK